MAKTYDENSIKKMDPRTFCRHRPDVYLGSSANSTQLVKEIVSNSVDEAIAGNCSTIWVDIDYSKNKVKVRDNGQGILPNVWKDSRTVLEMVYGDINTSGKYEHDENSAYKISTGAFGIGGALSNWLSKTFTAQTSRGGCAEVVNFQDGLFEDRDVFHSDPKEHGVIVEFMPDPQFFDDPHPNESELVAYLRDVVCLVPNLTIEYNGRVFKSINGISDILENWSHESADLTPKRFKCEFDDVANNKHLYCAAMFRDTSEAVFSAFCNYAPIEGGTPLTAIKTVITKVFNSWGQDNNILKENEKLSGNAIQEGIVFAFNLVSNDIRYDSQTKVRVTSTTDNDFIAANLTNALTKWLNDNPQQSKALIEKSVIAKRAAEAAKRARDAVKNKDKGKIKMAVMPSKLADCHIKNRKLADLYVVEGDSAAGGMKTARDASTQAILGLKGKPLNTLTSSCEQILKNQEIQDLLRALGLDYNYNQRTKKLEVEFNERKLRYGKIIIASDRDPDGEHIQALLLTFFWTYIPDLVRTGYIYIANPPLYKAEWGKEYKYIKNQNELEVFKKKHKGKFTLTYYKGLGESSPDELKVMILDPKTRDLSQVNVVEATKATKIINELMGKDSKPKKKFVFNREAVGY